MATAKSRYIFRILHRDNVPWVLANGVTSRSHPDQNPHYVNIGNLDLIGKRAHRLVPIPPGGVLDDYLPFYFCTHSVMLFNIHTGRVEGVNCGQGDIVYLVSSIERLDEVGARYVFTDRHAYVSNAHYFSDRADLTKLDWQLIESRDFRRDPNDPGKLERRQAECLVHRGLPVDGLLGIACQNDRTLEFCVGLVAAEGLHLKVLKRTDWYF
ncbi:MAG: DUF4433 domain-containing protein [Proteobacteria bacterium]|nr:DUF4433 domain-containing protein [Pseudomonadota bacterium]